MGICPKCGRFMTSGIFYLGGNPRIVWTCGFCGYNPEDDEITWTTNTTVEED